MRPRPMSVDNASRLESPLMSKTRTYQSTARDTVRRRAAGNCEKCGSPFRERAHGLTDATMHHRHKREHGGRDTVTNLLLIHASCHRALHRDEEWAAEFGWIVWSDESSWKPCLIKVAEDVKPEWVIMTAEGDYDECSAAMAGELLGDCRKPQRLGGRQERRNGRRAA